MIKIYYYLLAHNMLCSGAPSQIHLWSGSSVLVLFNCRPCTKKSDFREKPVLSLSLSMGGAQGLPEGGCTRKEEGAYTPPL